MAFMLQKALSRLLREKKKEVQSAKRMFWGYGGTLCNPLNQVQPFLQENMSRNEKTYLVMAYTPSEMNSQTLETEFFSQNKNDWSRIPKGIHVYGSKYAIVCKYRTVRLHYGFVKLCHSSRKFKRQASFRIH